MRLENQGSTGPRKGCSSKKQKTRKVQRHERQTVQKLWQCCKGTQGTKWRAEPTQAKTHPGKNPKHTTRAPKHNTKPQAKPKHNTRAPKHTKPQGNPKQTQGKEATTKELGVSATHPEQSRRYIIINVSKSNKINRSYLI